MNKKNHGRQSIRLKGYDYARTGNYFITICNHDRRCVFGTVENAEMILNAYGTIAYEQWFELPKRFPNVSLGAFQVMPNHIHGIITLNETTAGATFTVAPIGDAERATVGATAGATVKVAPAGFPTIGDIVGAYKSLVVHKCLEYIKIHEPKRILGKLWQRDYWDCIIRDNKAFENISRYIRNNPVNWSKDKWRS